LVAHCSKFSGHNSSPAQPFSLTCYIFRFLRGPPLEVLVVLFSHPFTTSTMVAAPLLPVVGLDVSKATLAVCYQVNELVKHLEVSNNKAGH